jgi:selenophosphate synthetase-related protein
VGLAHTIHQRTDNRATIGDEIILAYEKGEVHTNTDPNTDSHTRTHRADSTALDHIHCTINSGNRSRPLPDGNPRTSLGGQ